MLVPKDIWIEAKTVERSPGERAILERMAEAGAAMRGPLELTAPHPTIIKKFGDHFDDALKKLKRQSKGEIIVYFVLDGIDFPTKKAAALHDIREWAERVSSETGIRVVISRLDQWRDPFLDTAQD